MTINSEIKKLVVDAKINNELHRTDIINVFKISNGSLYNWTNKYYNNQLDNNTHIRKKKITMDVRCYIRKYVLARPNFNYKNLIGCIKRKFNIVISKSSLYNILKGFKIVKKKIYKKQEKKNTKQKKQ